MHPSDALRDLEEAVEIGSPDEVVAAAAAVIDLLTGRPGRERARAVVAQVRALAEAGAQMDRGRAATLCAQVRADGMALDAPATIAPAAPTAPGPVDGAAGWTVGADSADMLADFAVEARGLLDEAEGACLALDRSVTPAAIAMAFRAFHTIKGVAGFLELTVLAHVAHRIESVLAEVRDGAPPPDGFVDLILRSIDVVRAGIAVASRGGAGDRPDADGLLREIEAALAGLARRPSDSQPTTLVPVIRSAASTQAIRVDDLDERAVVKVDIAKMDHIIDLVGELAIAQAQVAAHPELASLASRELGRAIGLLGRVAKELQHASLAMRMVALKGTFDRMARIARDTARGLAKPLAFVVEGAHTELDRTMVEAIYDPLVHLVRNAIDHGLEGPIERVRRGKPEAGTLTLRAFHQAGHIVVEIVDDGGGLDRPRIRARAVERGLIGADEVLTDAEVDQLIFAPGFSTAKAVTSVSGRGVGMDVVKTKIEQVRGRVEVGSVPGAGTTVRLRLPLTLAIIDGLLLRLGEERFVMPTSWAKDLFRPSAEQLISVRGRGQMVKLRGAVVPVVHLAERLGLAGAARSPTEGVLVLVEDGGHAVCLAVDELLGKQEVVVKGLGPSLAGVAGLAGATILGDGRVALILDIPSVLGTGGRRAEREVA
ncbi:MAG: chemotaxis protein CheA [Myxococcales bacterium]|nr:chemotaxis protein CheA [Myxococcales bacterium]MBK7195973.1 chemotaxis protein CheA [Myxococcales bacterium]